MHIQKAFSYNLATYDNGFGHQIKFREPSRNVISINTNFNCMSMGKSRSINMLHTSKSVNMLGCP